MTRGIAIQGHKWSLNALHDGWGPDATDELICQLGDETVQRFHAIAAEHKSDAHWTPYTSEVSVHIYGQHTEEHATFDRIQGETDEGLEAWREQAEGEVCAAWIEGGFS